MPIEFIWQLPTSGDGRYGDARPDKRSERLPSTRAPFTEGVSDPRGEHFNYFDYLHQVARAADLAGFDGIQIRHDLDGDESWIVAGYVARSTRHLKLLTEFDAARGSAVYAAKNAVSYQRFTGGRFAWHVIAGDDAQQRRRHGDYAAEADLLPRIEEFVTVARGVQNAAPYSFKGRFFEVLDGGFKGPLANQPLPPVYLSGDSDDAYRLSARAADVHVLGAAPVNELKPVIAYLQQLAAAAGRSLSIGLRIDILARDSEEEALRDARRYRQQSGDQASHQTALDGTRLWPGFATERTGAAASLVGSHEQVAQQLVAYADAGISSFVLAATPHLEEAYRIGENVLPAVRAHLDGSGLKAA